MNNPAGFCSTSSLLPENKINGQHQKHKRNHVVGAQGLTFKGKYRKAREYQQGDHLLDHLQLPERKRPAIPVIADLIGRHLEHILQESDSPAKENHLEKAHTGKPGVLFQPQVAVPRHCHENIGKNQKCNGIKCFHRSYI